jgi:lipoprotein signal peptidase
MAAMVVIGAWMFPRVGSPLIAVAGGLMVGGGLSNVLSLGLWGRGVPNPLLSDRLHIAFNLADVAIGLGLLSMLAGILLFAVQHRAALHAQLW